MAEIRGAHIFNTGTWNGIEITPEILDSLVQSFEKMAQAGRVPLKLGHNDEQAVTDGQPAIGWLTKVWRSGTELLADFAGMPAVIFDAIKQGLYRFVSVEILRDVEWEGSKWPAVLDAVALLGADRPAVTVLKDLQQLTAMSRQIPSMRVGARASFRQDFPPITTHGDHQPMSDKDTDVKSAIEAALGPLQAQVKDITEKFSAASATLKTTQDENAKLKADAETLAKKERTARVAANKERFKAHVDATLPQPGNSPHKRDEFMKKFCATDEQYHDLDFDLVTLTFGKPAEPRERQRPTSFSRASATDSNEEAINIDRRKAVREYQSAHPQADSFTANAAVMRLNPDLAREFKALVFGQPN